LFAVNVLNSLNPLETRSCTPILGQFSHCLRLSATPWRLSSNLADDLLRVDLQGYHENLDTLNLYAQALRNKDQRAREAANRQDRYTFAAIAVD
jgi:hypothetical protein